MKHKKGKLVLTLNICILVFLAMYAGLKDVIKTSDIPDVILEDAMANNMDDSSESAESNNKDLDNNNTRETTSELLTEETLNQKVYEKIKAMTIEEKVGQLFMITPEALTGYNTVTAAGEATKQALEQYPIGGLIYFSSNIVDSGQLKKMTSSTQRYARELGGIPLFLGVDEEGGSVARIGNHTNFDVQRFSDMELVGETGDSSQAYEVGNVIGRYLSSYGFNLDFAPVADVLSNPQNTVIKNRSFGSDAQLVSQMALEMSDGLMENNVYSCFKHFPGHGATAEDTHEGYAYIRKTLEELKQSELIPFQMGIDHGLSFIMVSHISAPDIVGDYTPASLSETLITDILRNDMGFDGIVITDAMNMGAIVNHYKADEAAVKAIKAGVDIILMPESFSLAYEGILEAVRAEELSEERINQSVARILSVKYR